MRLIYAMTVFRVATVVGVAGILTFICVNSVMSVVRVVHA